MPMLLQFEATFSLALSLKHPMFTGVWSIKLFCKNPVDIFCRSAIISSMKNGLSKAKPGPKQDRRNGARLAKGYSCFKKTHDFIEKQRKTLGLRSAGHVLDRHFMPR